MLGSISGEVKRKNYHHGNLYQALLDAALDALENGTLAALSLRGLARECGVSQTAPYRHFASKEHLMAVLAESGAERLLSKLNAARQLDVDPWKIIREIAKSYLDFAEAQPAYFQLIFNVRVVDRSRYPSLQRCLHRIEAVFAQPLTKASSPDNLSENARLVWSYVHGLATLTINEVAVTTANEKTSQLDLFIKLLQQDAKPFVSPAVAEESTESRATETA